MTRNPHKYIARERTCPPEVYDEMADLLDAYALPEKWYRHIVYCYYVPVGSPDNKYWRMGDIINRDRLGGWSAEDATFRLEHLIMSCDFTEARWMTECRFGAAELMTRLISSNFPETK